MIRRVAPGVLVLDTSVAAGKAGVIAGSDVALAVDAGIDDTEGAASLDAATSLGRPEVRLVYTHGHVDHALGGTAFAGHEIVGRPGIVTHMRAQLDAWAERTGEGRTALEARFGWPTIIVDGETELDLGGRRIRLLDTPGHAPDALCVLDPDGGILFGGDTVVTAIPPAFSDGDSATLEKTLRKLVSLDAEILIPGHGDIVEGRAAVRDAISWSADYLARCRDHVAAHEQQDPDVVVAAAPFGTFIGDHLPRHRHRMEWRHEQTVRMMIAETRAS